MGIFIGSPLRCLVGSLRSKWLPLVCRVPWDFEGNNLIHNFEDTPMKSLFSWLNRHRFAFGFIGAGLLGVGSARADTALDTSAFSTALTTFTSDLQALVAVMAPALVTIAGVTLILVAINWLVRKVRGAIGRG